MVLGVLYGVNARPPFASAQDAKVSVEEAVYSAPFPILHPLTGEQGLWIPVWLQRRHLQDDSRLKTCIVDLSGADDELMIRESEVEHLRAAVSLEEQATLKLGAALADSRTEQDKNAPRLRRRTSSMWVFLGGLVVASGLSIFAFTR